MSDQNARPAIFLGEVVLDCREPDKLSKFYRELLRGSTTFECEGFVIISIPGAEVRLAFQRDEDYERPFWPGVPGKQQQMLHLDFMVDDPKSSLDYALSLGATLADTQFCDPNGPQHWTTLIDPEGHPFCLCEKE